jgi:hypothetical protein
LTKPKIHQIIQQRQEEVTRKQIALDMMLSRRRVQQVWKGYREQKQGPTEAFPSLFQIDPEASSHRWKE